MTTITIERATLDRLIDAWDSTVLPKSRDGMMQERMEDLRAALAAPATAPAMTEIDYNDDNALRFVQRVLESDAPESDTKAALEMVVSIRTRVLKARASKPATAPEPICTKCGDVITAHDPGLCGCCLSTRDATSPSWQDAPTEPGMWACLYAGELSTAIFNAYEIEHFDRDEMVGCRWQFIPEDRP